KAVCYSLWRRCTVSPLLMGLQPDWQRQSHVNLSFSSSVIFPPHSERNHCAYVIEKTVSFTVQDGAAPYVKAEYNKCFWGQKCPTLLYRLLYKPIYKVAHKTVTELEWRCCPGYSGYGCMEGHSVYHHHIKMMPPFQGPPMKGPQFKGPQYKGPMFKGPSMNTAVKHSQGPEDIIPEEIPPPPSGGEQATVNGLEDSLRASLREDANRMLSALLSAAPVPAPAVASSPSTVGYVEIPGGGPDTEGLDGRHVFPGLTELNERVEELRTELQAKTAELQELKVAVIGHDGALEKISNKAGGASHFTGNLSEAMEKLMDAKLSAARIEILGGFEKRVESAESQCVEKAGDVSRQCQREQGEQQEQMEDALQESTTKTTTELRNLQAQVHGLKATESCCGRMTGLDERVQLLETSVTGLNQSQRHLRVELGGHKDHIEGMLEGRLAYVETKLNLTGQIKSDESGKKSGVLDRAVTGQGLEARMEGKLRALEGRLMTAFEELGNATAPALLEGHVQLNSLESLCTSSCSSPEQSAIKGDSAPQSEKMAEEQNVKEALDLQGDRLNSFNITLQNILKRLTLRDQQQQTQQDSSIQGELTILKFNVRSVNHTLRGLQDSLGTVVHQVGQANSTWHERESRMAQQIKGVVQLVGHQASMLGAGERRLTRLKGELQEMKRRLAQEVRGCQSTAMVVQKEVTEVGGRVASVEDQCKGLNYVAEDLERIREELERQSNDLLLQVNGTLSSHAQQLSELKGELRNCTSKVEPTQQSLEMRRGDTFTLNESTSYGQSSSKNEQKEDKYSAGIVGFH
uniref:Elastin microfibril interfacer 3a n=1 Tax=Acanthochromis polyacanthus TaxID=80966 RepID=A0A3Q1EH40_9TELE